MNKRKQTGPVKRFSISLKSNEIKQLQTDAKQFNLKNYQQMIRQVVRHYLSLERGNEQA